MNRSLKYQFLVAFLLFSFFVQAQKTDSLLLVLKNTNDDSAKVLVYRQLALNAENYEQSVSYFKESIIAAQKAENQKLLAGNYNLLARLYYKNSKYSDVLPLLDKSYPLYLELKDTAQLAKIAYIRGRCYSILGQNKKAIEAFLDRLDWEKKQNNTVGIDRAYIGLSYAHADLDKFEIALDYAQKAYEIEKANNLDVSYGQDMIAGVYERMGDYTEAKKYYQLAIANATEDPNSINHGIGLSNIGNIYLLTGVYDSAMYYFLDFLEIAKNVNDDYYTAIAYNQITEVQLELQELDKAEKNARRAIDFYKKEEIKTDYLIGLELLGKILLKQKNYTAAQKVVNEGLKALKTAQSKTFFTKLYNLSGELNRLSDKPQLALKDHNRALAYAKENDNKGEMSFTYYQLALTEKALSNYEKAFEFGEISLEIAQKVGFRHYINDIYKLLADLAALQNNYAAAYDYQLRFQSMQDSMLNDEKTKYLLKYHTEFQLDETEAENELLKDKQAASQIVIQQQTLIGALLGLGLLVFLGIASWLFYNNRQKQFYNQKLEEQVAERTEALQVANKNLEQANYELRTFNYIASHDIKEPIRNIGSYVGLIFRKLPNDLKSSLGDYFTTIKNSTTQLYTLIEDFARYTSLSKDESIDKEKVSLNELANTVEMGLEETINSYNGKVIYNDLPVIQSNNSLLYTIFKNLIENGLKYNQSDTPTVEVSFQKTPTHYQIFFKDNGIGIKAEYHERIFEMFKRLHNRAEYEGSGIGLAIVKLSVSKLEGKIQIDSAEGEGSEFLVYLPV